MNIFTSRVLRSIVIAAAFALVFTGSASLSQAQQRVNDRQVKKIIRSVEKRSDRFRKSADSALDRSRLDGTDREDSIIEYVRSFEDATDALRSRFNGKTVVTSDVDTVLNRAAVIDQFMRTNLRQPGVQRDWTRLRADLQRLANAYHIAFNLNGRVLQPSVVAAQIPYRVSDREVQTLLDSIETRSDSFRSSVDRALDRSRLDGTNREDNINDFVADFEKSTDALRSKFDGRTSVSLDVSHVLVRGARIDDLMKRSLLSDTAAQREWQALRSDLNMLANYYNLAFNLDNRINMPLYVAGL